MTLETIGQKLKSAREAQGLSLRQIYERTKIPITHLQAIDTGQSDDLPEPVYVAGFIKRYAECIGLDGQVLSNEYRHHDESEGNGNGNGKSAKPASAQPLYVTPEYLKHTRMDDRAPSYKLWPFYLVIIVALMGLLSWYYNQNNKANQVDPSVLSLKDSVSRMQQMPNTATGTPQASDPNQANPGANDKITLSANQHVWVDVKRLSSGESISTGFMEQGDRREFQEPEGLRVTAGNGGSLSVEVKGKTEPFGLPGKRAERTFAATAKAEPDSTQPSTSATGDASTAGSSASASSATAKPIAKPHKPRPSTPKAEVRRDGTRAIPGEEGGHSIDVPYRFDEGRLDNN